MASSIDVSFVDFGGTTIASGRFSPRAQVSDLKRYLVKCVDLDKDHTDILLDATVLDDDIALEALDLPKEGATLQINQSAALEDESQDLGSWSPDISLWRDREVRLRVVRVPLSLKSMACAECRAAWDPDNANYDRGYFYAVNRLVPLRGVPVGRDRLLVYPGKLCFCIGSDHDEALQTIQPTDFVIVGANEDTDEFDNRPSPVRPFVGVHSMSIPIRPNDAAISAVKFDGKILSIRVLLHDGTSTPQWFRIKGHDHQHINEVHFEEIAKPHARRYHLPEDVREDLWAVNRRKWTDLPKHSGLELRFDEEKKPSRINHYNPNDDYAYGATLLQTATGRELGKVPAVHGRRLKGLMHDYYGPMEPVLFDRHTLMTAGPQEWSRDQKSAECKKGYDVQLFDWQTGERIRGLSLQSFHRTVWEGYQQDNVGLLPGNSQSYFSVFCTRGGACEQDNAEPRLALKRGGYVYLSTPDPETFVMSYAEERAEISMKKHAKVEETQRRQELVDELYKEPYSEEIILIEQTIRFCELVLNDGKDVIKDHATKPNETAAESRLRPEMMRTMSGVSALVPLPSKQEQETGVRMQHHGCHGKKGNTKNRVRTTVHHTAETLYFFSRLEVDAPMTKGELNEIVPKLQARLDEYKTKLEEWKSHAEDRETAKTKILNEGYNSNSS